MIDITTLEDWSRGQARFYDASNQTEKLIPVAESHRYKVCPIWSQPETWIGAGAREHVRLPQPTEHKGEPG